VNTLSVADVSASTASRPLSTSSITTLDRQRLVSTGDIAATPLSRVSIPEARIGFYQPIVPAAGARVIANTPSTGPARAARTRAEFWSQLRDGLTVRGGASWYPGTYGYGGTAHVAMPGADYLIRGTKAPLVRVCVSGRCRTVPVVDSCGCYWGTTDGMIVDLSLPLVHALGLDPSLGIYKVEITLVRG
jgi:hypothetical protein